MIRLLKNWPVILCACCIFSCKKPTDDPNDIEPGSPFLSKVMIWNTEQPQKAIQIIDFKYDNLNRITDIVYSSGDSANGTINASTIRTNQCFYNGNETTPYKTIGFKLPIGYPTGDVLHYYNTTGTLTGDSTGTWGTYEGYYKREFAWSADKVITTQYHTYSGYLKQTKDTMFIDGNNITVYKTTKSGSHDEYTFKYDNKINPLAELNITAFTAIDGIDGIEEFVAPGYCKNNITETSLTSIEVLTNGTSTSTKKTAYMYTYNKSGLPIERIVHADRSTTTKYYYREE